MIDGVRIKELRVIPDERGRLMEILRADDELFMKFGQIYVTTVYPGVTKAWHYHKLQHDHFAAVQGMIKVGLYDSREGSPTKGETQALYMGVHKPLLVQIPPFVYHGFKCISPEEAIIVNCPTETYKRDEPDEFRLPAHTSEIPFDWDRKDG